MNEVKRQPKEVQILQFEGAPKSTLEELTIDSEKALRITARIRVLDKEGIKQQIQCDETIEVICELSKENQVIPRYNDDGRIYLPEPSTVKQVRYNNMFLRNISEVTGLMFKRHEVKDESLGRVVVVTQEDLLSGKVKWYEKVVVGRRVFSYRPQGVKRLADSLKKTLQRHLDSNGDAAVIFIREIVQSKELVLGKDEEPYIADDFSRQAFDVDELDNNTTAISLYHFFDEQSQYAERIANAKKEKFYGSLQGIYDRIHEKTLLFEILRFLGEGLEYDNSESLFEHYIKGTGTGEKGKLLVFQTSKDEDTGKETKIYLGNFETSALDEIIEYFEFEPSSDDAEKTRYFRKLTVDKNFNVKSFEYYAEIQKGGEWEATENQFGVYNGW